MTIPMTVPRGKSAASRTETERALKQSTVHIYFGKHHRALLERLLKLKGDNDTISLSGLIVILAYAGIDDIEKGLSSDKREFTVNKTKVRL